MGKAIFDKGIKITNGQDVTTTPTYLTATNTNGDIEKTDPIQFAGNSAGAISGFEITNNGNGTVNIATGIAILRSANNTTSPLVKYTIPAQTNISLTDNANNFLLVNYNGGTPNILVTTNPTDINTTTNSIIYVISRVGNTLDYIALIGQNVDVNAKLRRRFLNSEGLTRAQGGVLTVSNRNLLVTIGLFYSGLIEVTTPTFNTSGADTFTQAYLNTNWNRTTGLSQINNTQYNLAGTLTTLPNNAYRVDYVYLLADNPSKLYVILGDAHYNSLADARLAPVPSSLPTELQYLGARIGRVIVQKNASTMEVSSEFTTIYASGSATLHNDLGGLNVGDYQHLTVAEKAAIVTASGTTNRIPKFNSSNTLGDSVLIQVGGNLGMGSAVVPGELFHIGDGNILLEGGGEVAQKFKRDFSTTGENLGVPTGSGVSVNPIFQIGRIIQAGDGDPEIRIMYSDDNTVERTVFEVDRKGIVASVKTAIGSHYEGFASLTDVNPMFRLNSYPRMRLEMGAGGNNVTDVAVERGASGELAFFTNSTKRGEFDSSGNLSIITTPTTSASGYDILTRNTSTGKVEKIASSGLGGDMLLGTAQTFTGTKSFSVASLSTPALNITNALAGGGSSLGIYLSNTNDGTGIYINQTGSGSGITAAVGGGNGFNASVSVAGAVGYRVLSSNATQGIYSTNNGTSHGIFSLNSSTGSGIYSQNGSTGNGIVSTNGSTGFGIFSQNSSSGIGMRLDNSTAATGKPFQYTKNSVEKVFINDAGDLSAQSVTVLGTLGLRNVANTFTSLFTNTNTASRTYTLPDKSMTVAGLVDIPFTTTGNDISNSNTNSVLIGTSTANPSISKFVVKGTVTGSGSHVIASFLDNSGIEKANISDLGGMVITSELTAGGVQLGTGKLTVSNNGGIAGTSSKFILSRTSNWEFIGLAKYDVDYSALYDARSLVDKGYVDSKRVQRLAQYTVGTLPTGVQGDNAYVTDALAPTYMAIVVGGGSVVTPVFYNGSSWIAH
jgi:hypothetical protein